MGKHIRLDYKKGESEGKHNIIKNNKNWKFVYIIFVWLIVSSKKKEKFIYLKVTNN